MLISLGPEKISKKRSRGLFPVFLIFSYEKYKHFHFVYKYLKETCNTKTSSFRYERVSKMLENDMNIAGISQAVLKLLSFKVG